MEKLNLLTVKSRVRYLAEMVDGVTTDPNRGRLLMMLLYWKLFDGIDIPPEIMRQILEKGTHPESLGRLMRFVLKDIKDAKCESLEERTDETHGETYVNPDTST